MSNKSLFEKLFTQVMENDETTVGGMQPDMSGGSEGGQSDSGAGEVGGSEGEGEEMVSISIPKKLAEELHDFLVDALGGESEGEDESEFESEFPEASAPAPEEGKSEDSEAFGGVRHESPQSEYVDFPNKGESLKNKNNKVAGATASNVSGAGKASQTSQTPGTDKYMPAKTTYQDGKSMKASSNLNPSGAGKSAFHR